MNENNQDNAQQCKVVLLGETFVGKTCIINRFINNKFETDVSPTKGASFEKKQLKLMNLMKKYSICYMGYRRTRKISFFIKNFL